MGVMGVGSPGYAQRVCTCQMPVLTQEKGGGEKGEGMGNNETFQSVQNGTSETAINANKTI